MDFNTFKDFKNKIIENISKVIVGKDDVIELAVVAFICGGHLLVEDVPGVGKTMLIKAFAKTIGCTFKRIQFTPDLLPSDLTGINFYNQKKEDFEFRFGPLFSNIILADEINRATPRTQSSLLEAMEEAQITVDGITRKLEKPFMVLATENPVESYGTFPLPEAQLDRFFMRINMGYPTREEEIKIISMYSGKNPLDDIDCVIDGEMISYVQNNYSRVKASDDVIQYIMDIIGETRHNDKIMLGVSPRGTIALFKACQAYAAVNGREFIIPEDVKAVAPFVLNHRITAKGIKKSKNMYELINSIIDNVKTPVEDIR